VEEIGGWGLDREGEWGMWGVEEEGRWSMTWDYGGGGFLL